ncbi:hypothetical protein PENTCL1PPCAC_25645, partial [Pristionchus entomophagus]
LLHPEPRMLIIGLHHHIHALETIVRRRRLAVLVQCLAQCQFVGTRTEWISEEGDWSHEHIRFIADRLSRRGSIEIPCGQFRRVLGLEVEDLCLGSQMLTCPIHPDITHLYHSALIESQVLVQHIASICILPFQLHRHGVDFE